jgi:pimeloyl-ACP methyl ester carboxylesterase
MLRSIDVPCLLLTGTRSTAAARHAVALLRGLMRNVQVLALDGLGHMGPVTHAERVDAAIDAFLSASAGKHRYLVGTHPAPTLSSP